MKKLANSLLMLLLVLLPNLLIAQNVMVTGSVINNANGKPMEGVSIVVKGKTSGTQTDSKGQFSISANPSDILSISSVNFITKHIKVGSNKNINVRLETSLAGLDEVVVTSYGLNRARKSLGGVAQTVSGAEIADAQRDNWINALSGRIAGINITSTSGAPGASTTIVLRGAVSLGGNNQPLFVVDGVPYDNQTLNQENLIAASNASGVAFANRNSDYTNRAADINPDDIENVTVLKGPEASALYGSDGASGAIVITTKKGKAGRATVSYDNSFRAEKLYLFPQVQNVYARGTNGFSNPDALISVNGVGNVLSYFGAKYAPGTTLYNNTKNFFQTGFTQKHNVSLSGGSDFATYRLSANYTKQKGVIPTTGLENYAVKLTGTLKINAKLSISTSLNFLNSLVNKSTKGAGGYLMDLLEFPQDIDVRDYQNPDGTRKMIRASAAGLFSSEFDNPLWDVNKNRSKDKVNRTTNNLVLNYKPFSWLSFANNLGVDYYNVIGDNVVNPQSRYGVFTNGFYSIYTQTTQNFSDIFSGTANKKFGDFDNTLTLGTSIEDSKTRIEAESGERFYEPDFVNINNTDPLSRNGKSSIYNIRKTRLFGNYVLGYHNLAFLSLAGSREGLSTLMSRAVDKNPYYNFGSASFSFVFSDLKWLKQFSWLNLAKGRISYGTTGKGPALPYIVDYTFVSQITTGGGYAFGVTGNNVGLRPEYSKNLEFGGEFKFLKNRVSLDITRYHIRSTDQILAARSSYGTGTVIKYFNGGIIVNKGIEATLKFSPILRKNLTWDVTVNFDRNRGKILEMPADLPYYYDSDTWALGNLRSQSYLGAFTGNLSGNTVARNVNGDPLISTTTGLPLINTDFVPVGDRSVDYKVGLINKVTYKNFSLSFNLDFRKGGDVFNGNEYFMYVSGLSKKTLNRETPVMFSGVLSDGLQNTTTPTRSNIIISPFYRSDYYSSGGATEADFIESVNWMRLRDATLSYTFSPNLIKKQHIVKSASIFITGTDLFIITNYTGADPSVNVNSASARGYGGSGIDFGSISTPRGINFGCNLKF